MHCMKLIANDNSEQLEKPVTAYTDSATAVDGRSRPRA